MSKQFELDDVVAKEEQEQQIEPPGQYKVVLINDDYTPMEFVVEVLTKFFSLTPEQATEVMLTVHYKGKGVCGLYSRDVAETKASQVTDYARAQEHPLLCSIEQA